MAENETKDTVALIFRNDGEPPPAKKWNEFDGAPVTEDKALERAVHEIGAIALAGGIGIFNASAVRKVLIDLCKEKARDVQTVTAEEP
jgi:hypothetical protein